MGEDAFEERLGDAGAAGPFSWAAAVARDEAEAFPAEALAALHAMGVPRWHVPTALGGAFVSFEHLLGVGRSLSRRDPSLALTAGFAVWSQLAWMAGTSGQQARVRDSLLRGDGCCLAVSEPAHGADLLASDVTARRTPGGFVLDGTKWPIGLASRARLAFVLARTGDGHGPRDLSWLLLEGESLERATRLRPARTLGLRGADLAGLGFRQLPIPAEAELGPAGSGIELTLRLFQITRVLVTGFSLGMADSALRIATAFALGRRLYRTQAAALPVVEDLLVSAFTDLLAAQAVARASARGLHTSPDQMSAASDLTKAIVPELAGRALSACAQVLGARFFLREGVGAGIFQKLLRDHQAMALFDGSTAVCLQSLALQLPLLLGPPPGAGHDTHPARFAFGQPLPPFESRRLELTCRGRDDVVQGLAGRGLSAPLRDARDELAGWHRHLVEELAAFRASRNPEGSRSPRLIHLAHRYARLHAAAACLQTASQGDTALDPGWAPLCVRRLLAPEAPLREQVNRDAFLALRDTLFRNATEPRAFSLAAPRLPDSPITDPSFQEGGMTAENVQRWLIETVAVRLGCPEDTIDVHAPFETYGLDSLEAVSMAGDLEVKFSCRIEPTALWDHRTIAQLAHHVSAVASAGKTLPESEADLDRLLLELGNGIS